MSNDGIDINPFPNLAGVAKASEIERIKAGSFAAEYLNWSRTMQHLREHAPGWLPYLEPAQDTPHEILHDAPVGCYLLIGFCHPARGKTPPVPQAIMDSRNNAIPRDRITARDITDTHRRGICLAAAMTFGLAYELWAKLPLESGYVRQEKPEASDQNTYSADVDKAYSCALLLHKKHPGILKHMCEEFAIDAPSRDVLARMDAEVLIEFHEQCKTELEN